MVFFYITFIFIIVTFIGIIIARKAIVIISHADEIIGDDAKADVVNEVCEKLSIDSTDILYLFYYYYYHFTVLIWPLNTSVFVGELREL